MGKSSLTLGIKTIISVNSIAAVITLLFWLLVLFKLFIEPGNELSMNLPSKASTFGFLIADLLWAVPILILSIPGLLKLKSWGWLTAQLTNVLWVYSLTAFKIQPFNFEIEPNNFERIKLYPRSVFPDLKIVIPNQGSSYSISGNHFPSSEVPLPILGNISPSSGSYFPNKGTPLPSLGMSFLTSGILFPGSGNGSPDFK